LTKKLLYESDRLFSIYGYAMSHALLLLRSGKSTDTPTSRADILFRDVRAVEIRTWFRGIKIEEVDDPQFLDRHVSNPAEMIEHGNKIYALTGTDWNGFVVAGIMSCTEDAGELFGPSALVEEPPVKRWTVG
jgi:hypothetical protein